MKALICVTVLGMGFGQIACSSSSNKGTNADASAGGTSGGGKGGSTSRGGGGSGGSPTSGGSAGEDARAPEGGAEAGTPQCPTGLTCVAPTGVYICERPGPALVTCSTAADCTFGSCYKYSGQGICLQLCQPPEGFPESTSIDGVVVEFQAGKGFVGTSETPKETPIADVDVCLVSPKLNVPCVKSDASGKFSLTGLPPNRNVAIPTAALVSFKKTGYLSLLRGPSLGNGSQVLSPQTRMTTNAEGQAMATALGISVPDATTGWLGMGALKVNVDGTQRISALTEGTLKELYLDNVTFSATPTAGIGPAYADANELFTSVGIDASLDKTSIAGFGYLFNVPAGTYTITTSHPTLDCGLAQKVTAMPGFVYSYIGSLCGNGVK